MQFSYTSPWFPKHMVVWETGSPKDPMVCGSISSVECTPLGTEEVVWGDAPAAGNQSAIVTWPAI